MKKIFAVLITIIVFGEGRAQSIAGDWGGVADVMGQPLKAIFHIKKTGTDYSATFDSPDQNAFGLSADGVTVTGDSVVINLKVIGGSFSGKWNGKDAINGAIHQGGQNFAIVLRPTVVVEAPVVAQPKPQTPRPPFDYIIEEVTYNNNTQQVRLGATLTKPKGSGKFAVVLLITGSGQQDRDETIGLHKPFWVIADYLTKRGIAVLRVDDRGKGASTGDFKNSTSADFATDVMAGIDYLKTRNDIDVKHIGLLGHSEGGIVAPYVAARSNDVTFIVTLAGPVVGGKLTNTYQNILPLRKAGVPENDIDSFVTLHNSLVDAAINIKDDSAYKKAIAQRFYQWKKRQSESTIQHLVTGNDEEVIAVMQKNYADFKKPWWQFFLTYDFTKDVAKLHCAVLALNGEKDEQVESKPNLAAFNNLLNTGHNKNYKTVEIPGVNHLFQHCKDCGNVQEYLSNEETFSPDVLKVIGDWIKGVSLQF